MKKYYYWLGSATLAPGSIVNPGNWGRMLKLYNPGNSNGWIAFREYKYEEIRLIKYPEKPSRLECIFLCESEETLRDFQQRTGRVFDVAYEVEILDEQKPLFRADWNKVNIFGFEHPDNEKIIDEYWSGNDIINPEILTASDIKIIRRI